MVYQLKNCLVDSFKYIKNDKKILLYSLFPVVVGFIFYFWFGKFFFGYSLTSGQSFIEQRFGQEVVGKGLYYFLIVLLTISLFIIINWTFVLFVSLVSGPFNELVSARIETLESGKKAEGPAMSFMVVLKLILNEGKKIFFFAFCSLFSFLLSFIPILIPVSLMITSILVVSQFVDYGWSRHNLSFRDCVTDLRKNFLLYLIPGCLFTVLFPIPIVNLILLPFAVVFFSLLWIRIRLKKY